MFKWNFSEFCKYNLHAKFNGTKQIFELSSFKTTKLALRLFLSSCNISKNLLSIDTIYLLNLKE